MKIEDLDDIDGDINSGKQIVRVDAKRALVGAGARILFYPTLLHNVFRNKIQDEFRWWDQIDQSGNHCHGGDDSDSSSLIRSIGRDNSISALIRSSRSDYGSLASLNRSFRELIRSGELYRLRRHNGVVEHWVYFSYQLLGWEASDPTCHRWMKVDPNMIQSMQVYSSTAKLCD